MRPLAKVAFELRLRSAGLAAIALALLVAGLLSAEPEQRALNLLGGFVFSAVLFGGLMWLMSFYLPRTSLARVPAPPYQAQLEVRRKTLQRELSYLAGPALLVLVGAPVAIVGDRELLLGGIAAGASALALLQARRFERFERACATQLLCEGKFWLWCPELYAQSRGEGRAGAVQRNRRVYY